MTSPGKAKIDWLQREPGTERQPRKGIFCSVFQCKADGGNGDPTGRWKLKVFCKNATANGKELAQVVAWVIGAANLGRRLQHSAHDVRCPNLC